MSLIGRFTKELRRRQVFGTALIYVAAAWVLLQVVDLNVIQDTMRIDPKAVLIGAIVGFPIALVAGWIYDITPKGIFRTPPIGAGDSFDLRLRRPDFIIFFALALVWAGSFLLIYIPPVTDKSIAIMPFENRSHDPDSAIFAFGVRNDLQVHLTRLLALKVIASESVDKVAGKFPLDQIGSQLGAAYILKGSIDRIADRIHVNVLLIDASEGTHTWADSFDRDLSTTSLFEIRSDIANAVTNSLQVRLSDQERETLHDRPTEIFAAWEAYLLGEQRLAVARTDSVDDAVAYFQKAIALDPDFAEAYVGLANSYHRHEMLRGETFGNPRPVTDSKLAAAVENALRLNNRLGSAHAALADIKYHQFDYDGMREEFERAIALDPNDASTYWTYGHNIAQSMPEKSLSLLKKAIELNPMSLDTRSALARTLGKLNRPNEALQQYCKAIEIDPQYARTYYQGGMTYAFDIGRLDEAVRWTSKAVREDPDSGTYWHFLSYFYYALDDDARAVDAAKRYIALSPNLLMALSGLLHMYHATGPHEREQEYLDRLAEEYPDHPHIMDAYFSYHMRNGNYGEALAQITKFYPTLTLADRPTIDRDNQYAAMLLAELLMKTGEQQRANELLDDVLDLFQAERERRGSNEPPMEEIIALALRGKTTEALNGLRHITKRVDSNFWWRQNFEEPPWPEALQNEPDFQAMKAELREEMATQLARVREWEAAGELETVPCP